MRPRTRRASTRGAILVEGLIVLTFMTVFFAAQLWLYNLYKAEMEGFNRTQGVSFKTATSGCGSPLGSSYDIGKLLSSTAPDPYADNPDPAYLGTTINKISNSIGYSGAKPVVLGGGGWSRTVQTSVMCADPPMNQATIFASLGAIPWATDGVATAAGF